MLCVMLFEMLFEMWGGGAQMQNRLFCISVPICCGTEVHSGLFCTCVPRLILRNHWNFAVSLKAGYVVPWWPCGMQMQIRLFCMCVPICCGTGMHSGLFCTCVPRLISWNHWNFAASPKVRWVVLRDASAESVIIACASRICLVFASYHHGTETCFGELRHLRVPASGSCDAASGLPLK